MNFSDSSKVRSTIEATDETAFVRGDNRNRIYRLFNGEPLLDAQDAKRMNLRINVNWGEGARICQDARRQYSNAFLSRGNFFKVSLPDAPADKAVDWAGKITRKINRPLKNSEEYQDLLDNVWASVLLPGMGIRLWEDPHDIIPSFVAVEDFRCPTDTLCNLKNLEWFAIRKLYTEGELARKVWNKNSMPGWNKEAIAEILDHYHNENEAPVTYTWRTDPEKMAELVRQNGGYWSSDAVPTIPLWHFFFQGEDGKYYLRVVPAQKITGAEQVDDFLFDNGKKPFADKRNNFLHIQWGDLNTKAPFLVWSVRSMGFLLMEPLFYTNFTRCRGLQHLHENMNIWMRVSDPAGKARAQKIELYDRTILPDGVAVVPQQERHQVDMNGYEIQMADLKQLQHDASVSYTSDSQPRGTDETATAVMARVSAVNAMMSGLLNKAFAKEKFAYMEVSRRFCIRRSTDPMAITFQKECIAEGVPREWLNAERWEIEPEIPMGAGNPTMEMALTQQLLGMRPMFDGTAQQEILHEATVTLTGDPRKAERWVPIGKQRGVTDAQEYAELAFSTLMQGVPIRGKEGLSFNDQIQTLLYLMAGVVTRIGQSGAVATPAEIVGLRTVGDFTGKLIGQLAQDRSQKSQVKEFSDSLGNLSNEVKALAQQSEQQRQSQNGNGQDGKMQAMLLQAATKAKLSEQKTEQQQRHKEIAFQSEQQRQDASTFADIQRENVRAAHNVKNTATKHAVDTAIDAATKVNGDGQV